MSPRMPATEPPASVWTQCPPSFREQVPDQFRDGTPPKPTHCKDVVRNKLRAAALSDEIKFVPRQFGTLRLDRVSIREIANLHLNAVGRERGAWRNESGFRQRGASRDRWVFARSRIPVPASSAGLARYTPWFLRGWPGIAAQFAERPARWTANSESKNREPQN